MNDREKEPLPAVASEDRPEQPSPGELYLAGLVLPICSPSFYRHAVKRSAFAAFAFFVLLSLAIAAVQAVRVTADFRRTRLVIEDMFARGEIPEILIENGVATVNAPQPFVIVSDNRSLIVLDTTGTYQGWELAAGNYETGLILTRDTLFTLNDRGRVEANDLAVLSYFFPRVRIDAASADSFLIMVQTAVYAALFVWRVVLAPLYIALLGLAVWAVTGLLNRKVGLRAVLVTGYFAAVPALYVNYLMARIHANVFLLYTLVLLIVWTVGLVAAAGERRAGDVLRGERSLRAWRALLGLPMPAVFALDLIYRWDRGPLIVWGAAVLTMIELLAVGYLTGLRPERYETPDEVAPQV